MNLLKPNFKFNIACAATVVPESDPITNLEIIQNFPRTANKSPAFQEKLAKKITDELGFETRFWCHKPWETLDTSRGMTSETLSLLATRKILKRLGDNSIDAFLLGSTTNKRYTGSQAAAVLGQLGIEAPAYDLKAGCSTSLASLHMAYALMTMGYKNVLVSCAETLSKVINPNNDKTWISLADGAAALYLQASDQGCFTVEQSVFSTAGQYAETFTTQAVLPPTHQQINGIGYYLKGDEHLIQELAYIKYNELINLLLPNEQAKKDITWVIPHQVNYKLIKTVLSANKVTRKKILWHAHEIANIGGASVLYSLARAVEEGVFDKAGKILLLSVGDGLSFAGQVLDYQPRV